MIEFNGYSLEDGKDRTITRDVVCRITGLTNGRLAQLKDEIVIIGYRREGNHRYNLYSMRQVLEYCNSSRFQPQKKRSKTDERTV